MNINKFQHQHEQIFNCINVLRELSLAGIAENAHRIAGMVVSMSSVIKLHLAVEDKVLYPALRQSDNATLATMGDRYQVEMKTIASNYDRFVRRWNTASNVAQDPDGFRSEANQVLRMLHARIRREDREFYPQIAAL